MERDSARVGVDMTSERTLHNDASEFADKAVIQARNAIHRYQMRVTCSFYPP